MGSRPVPPSTYSVVFVWVIAVRIEHPNLVERDNLSMFCHIRVSEDIGLAQPYMRCQRHGNVARANSDYDLLCLE